MELPIELTLYEDDETERDRYADGKLWVSMKAEYPGGRFHAVRMPVSDASPQSLFDVLSAGYSALRDYGVSKQWIEPWLTPRVTYIDETGQSARASP